VATQVRQNTAGPFSAFVFLWPCGSDTPVRRLWLCLFDFDLDPKCGDGRPRLSQAAQRL